MVNYNKLLKKLEDYKNDPKHNGKEFMYDVSTKTIEDLCQLLQCQPQDIMDWKWNQILNYRMRGNFARNKRNLAKSKNRGRKSPVK